VAKADKAAAIVIAQPLNKNEFVAMRLMAAWMNSRCFSLRSILLRFRVNFGGRLREFLRLLFHAGHQCLLIRLVRFGSLGLPASHLCSDLPTRSVHGHTHQAFVYRSPPAIANSVAFSCIPFSIATSSLTPSSAAYRRTSSMMRMLQKCGPHIEHPPSPRLLSSLKSYDAARRR